MLASYYHRFTCLQQKCLICCIETVEDVCAHMQQLCTVIYSV